MSNDWRNCAAAGVLAGGLAGSTDDFDAVKKGAAVGAIIGSLVCALRHKDEDNDGVADDDDRCPGTFPGAAVDQNGCELDFDGDGVVDRLDECPDTVSGARVDAAVASWTAMVMVLLTARTGAPAHLLVPRSMSMVVSLTPITTASWTARTNVPIQLPARRSTIPVATSLSITT